VSSVDVPANALTSFSVICQLPAFGALSGRRTTDRPGAGCALEPVGRVDAVHDDVGVVDEGTDSTCVLGHVADRDLDPAAELQFQLSIDTEPQYDNVIVEAHTVGQDNWTTLPDLNGATQTDPPAECAEGGFLLSMHPFLEHYLGVRTAPSLAPPERGTPLRVARRPADGTRRLWTCPRSPAMWRPSGRIGGIYTTLYSVAMLQLVMTWQPTCRTCGAPTRRVGGGSSGSAAAPHTAATGCAASCPAREPTWAGRR
jgi:hypothetical protein